MAATRVSGTAPMAVLFDASGTTSTTSGVDTFRQITYSFNFGDDRGLTWAVSGKSKNTESGGPMAAHVFDNPGTYTVTLTAKDASGNTSTTTTTITVADPASVYAGTKTVCVSPSSNFTGCPSGAATATSYPSSWDGKRVLLHRGESFGNISLQDGNTGVQVGAYGSGSKPVVGSVGVGDWRPATANFANDITVMDLSVKSGMAQSIGQRVLFYRNDVKVTGGGSQMLLGSEDYWALSDPYRQVPSSSFYNAREIFFVENSGINSDTSSATYGIYGSGSRVAILGNSLGSQKMHTVRLTACDRCVVSHNELRGISADGIRHALKLHSNGMLPYSDSLIALFDGVSGWISSKVVISNNLLGNASDNNQWTAAICPQNDGMSEGIENVIAENNRFVRGANTVADLLFGGRKLTGRSNAVVSGAKLTQATCHTGALPLVWIGPYFPL